MDPRIEIPIAAHRRGKDDMNDKCEHSSAEVLAEYKGFSVLRCTWECGKDLIELDLGRHQVKTYTVDQLAALRAELDEARNIIIEADALSQADKQPRDYKSAALAVVRMMAIGVEAIAKLEKK